VEISAALAADLAILTEALDDPNLDLTQTMHDLARAAATAVASYIGLSVQIEIDGRLVGLSSFVGSAGPSHARTSLTTSLPLGTHRRLDSPSAHPGIDLVLYASTPGASVDLAADLSWLSADVYSGLEPGLALNSIKLDEDPALGAKGTSPGPTASISDLTIINQAVGVLIGRGVTPEQAQHQLNLDAARDNIDITAAARAVLAQIGRTAPQP
jgi:hypothetical protein